MSTSAYLPADQLRRALDLRDLADPGQGEHATQLLVSSAVSALHDAWGCTVRYVRNSPVVAVTALTEVPHSCYINFPR